jgi:hypothetical protein
MSQAQNDEVESCPDPTPLYGITSDETTGTVYRCFRRNSTLTLADRRLTSAPLANCGEAGEVGRNWIKG